MKRQLQGFAVTNDFHSSLSNWAMIRSLLSAERPRMLLIDSGDFFEGSAYYRLTGGEVESQVLCESYDYCCPGNHGYRHYLTPQLRSKTLCLNVVEESMPVFAPMVIRRIRGMRVAMIGILGVDAFTLIPERERIAHRILTPEDILWKTYESAPECAEHWVVFSHSGWEADRKLASACPFVSVMFSGHCHSDFHGPELVGKTLLIKSPENGRGMALVRLDHLGLWNSMNHRMSPEAISQSAGEICRADIETIRPFESQLSRTLGRLLDQWRLRCPEPEEIIRSMIDRLRRRFPAAHALLNVTCLRRAPLGLVLTVGDLFQLEPFGNELVHARLSAIEFPDLLRQISRSLGDVICSQPLLAESGSSGIMEVITTQYIAETHLRKPFTPANVSVGEVLLDLLTVQAG